MNKLLQLKKKILLLILAAIGIVFILTVFINNSSTTLKKEAKTKIEGDFDIINPSFTINNKQKISVKADRGNFINDQEILLENNVIFKSAKFKIKTKKALFNQTEQTAISEEISEFFSKKTNITSEGFEITKSGNIIFFNGKTKLNLKK